MKNRFTSIFLIILIVDSILTVGRSMLNLLNHTILNAPIVKFYEGLFHTIFLILAIAQVIISFTKKLKWSAKIIGLYPVTISMLSMIMGISFLFFGKSPDSKFYIDSLMRHLDVYLLSLGIVQFLIALWAMRDLSNGHYMKD
jgi:hypothetical protein